VEDIEELTEIEVFLNNLDKKMSVIKEFIADVMGKMGLLEEY
jgi:ribosomal protein L7/L12